MIIAFSIRDRQYAGSIGVEAALDGPGPQRKDMQDLRGLARSQALSFLRKGAQPVAPRLKGPDIQPARFPDVRAFTPSRLWQWVTEYLRYRFGTRHNFQTYQQSGVDTGVHLMHGDGDEIRIAIAGDWGTGTDEAAEVAARISEFKAHYTVHLGDVYYVGDPTEVNENFLGKSNPSNDFEPTLWPPGTQGSFALNGNHEMYARGIAYFDLMLPTLGPIVDGVSQKQGASFFCLENDFWRIVAVDTGYNCVGLPLLEYVFKPDCALPDELLDWLRQTEKPRPDDPRGIVILSHHQYFSLYDDWYIKPAVQLAEFFSRPVLWFWGHEHRLAIYPEYNVPEGLRAFGRCIGHGGMPVDLPPEQPKHPECPVEYVDRRIYENDENLKLGFNGFARLTLNREQLHVDYVDLHGLTLFSEDWRADGGLLTRTTATPVVVS